MAKKRKKRKINSRTINNRKIKTDYTGLYIWIAFFIIAFVLNHFSPAAAAIFGGIILLAIIRRGWELGR